MGPGEGRGAVSLDAAIEEEGRHRWEAVRVSRGCEGGLLKEVWKGRGVRSGEGYPTLGEHNGALRSRLGFYDFLARPVADTPRGGGGTPVDG